MTDLGPDWVPDEDGILSREGARLLIFDAEGNVLLIRGHDTHDTEHAWWFTVGGGVEPGESPREGAVREAREETGMVFDPGSVEGPVLHRKAEFRFRNVLARQEEVFFIGRVDAVRPRLKRQDLTDLEKQTLDEFAWLSPEELLRLSRVETVYPESLPHHVERWSKGWDGVMVELAPEGGPRGGWVHEGD